MRKKYQRNFSKINSSVLNPEIRLLKAEKIISVIKDFAIKEKFDLKKATVLDIGGSAGYAAKLFSNLVKKIYVVDIDENALNFGRKNNNAKNIFYQTGDAMNLPQKDKSIDIIICNQVYEHVPNYKLLIKEIYRVLTINGFCYFGAGNKYVLVEQHHNLPFLSWFPKQVSNMYLKIFRGESYYYENLLSYAGLKKLLKPFKIKDYTLEVIKNPGKFYTSDMIKKNNIISKFPRFILTMLMPLSPSYVFILTKR